MGRFTEVLLLAACTLLILPPSLAQDLEAFQPTVKHSPAHRKDGVIRGLLDTRQTYYYCASNYYICESTHCCPRGWYCCRGGSCCSPGYYCVVASNGVIGCCRNGRVCSGPVGPPSTLNPGPAPSPTTNYITSTNQYTTTSTSTSTSKSTTTFTTLVGVPTQTVGYRIIEVTVLDVNITWSQNWVQGTSSCSASTTSKSTSTGNSSFTYLFQSSSRNSGFYYYFNVVNYNTMWEVFINGRSDYKFSTYTTTNCTYFQSYVTATSSSPLPPTQNITVVVYGSDRSSAAGPWSLEFNKLLFKEQTPATSTTFGGLGSFTQTPNGPLANATGRVQPYRPLLVFGGILLAVLYYT